MFPSGSNLEIFLKKLEFKSKTEVSRFSKKGINGDWQAKIS
jgi:hypothetical protein